MRVQFSLVGHVERPADLVADFSSVPQVGDVVNWPGISQGDTVVRTVVWYPTHDDDGEPVAEPFVYVVVGQPRREDHGLQAMHQCPARSARSGSSADRCSEPDCARDHGPERRHSWRTA